MNLANALTLLRIFLVPALIISIVYYQPNKEIYRYIALGIFTLGSLTDAVDGYIARTFNQQTKLGTLLDPLADKLIVVSAFLCIFLQPHFDLRPPVWFIILIVFRDSLIVMGLIIVFFTTGKIHVSPNFLGKCTTFFQMATVILLLLQNSISPIFWNLTALLTVASGMTYVVREGRRLREHTN